MPKYINQTITCPHCGKSFKIKRFTVIDSRSMPRENQLIMSDELFNAKCPYCRNTSRKPYSFIWRDTKHDITLQFAASPEEKEKYLSEYENEEDIRIVDRMDDLQEKIMIFFEGYDDRLIELAKNIALKVMRQADKTIAETEFLFDMRTNMAEIVGIDKNKMARQLLPADQLYQPLQKEFENDVDSYEESTLIVDPKWAETFLKYADPDKKRFRLEDEKPEKTDEISIFFQTVDQLELAGDEAKAASLILDDFDDIWQKALAQYDKKPSLEQLDDRYDGAFNACGEMDMILMNEKKYKECMHVLETMMNTLDYTDDISTYHNFRKSYMEAMNYVQGKDAALAYLENWQKEEPDSAYVKGVEIDFWLGQDKEKALRLADQYVNMPLKQMDDDWLLDACENVAVETKNQDLERKINKARKKAGY